MRTRSAVFIFFVAIIIAVAVLTVPHGVSYAEGEVQIAEEPVGGETVYGDGKVTLRVILSGTAEDVDYVWYKSEKAGAAALKVASGKAAAPALTLSLVSESGYYRCVITLPGDGGTLTSSGALVLVEPREAEVEISKEELVYNGSWQRPSITVKSDDILEGDTVNAYWETESATVGAGVYDGTVKFDNPNYKVKGNKTASFEIKKAPLTVRVKEIGVKAGQSYELQLEYIGLVGSDSENDLGFIPEISGGTGITTAGVYEINCLGESESANYIITYEPSKLFINGGTLDESAIEGIVATAGGSFREGTVLRVTETNERVKGIALTKVAKYKYRTEFVSGGVDGESYILNINDSSISKFLLAARLVDGEGNKVRTEFSYSDGIFSISLPTDFDGVIVIYNDYTLFIILLAAVVAVALFTAYAIHASKEKYRAKKYCYEAAEREADRWRPRRKF